LVAFPIPICYTKQVGDLQMKNWFGEEPHPSDELVDWDSLPNISELRAAWDLLHSTPELSRAVDLIIEQVHDLERGIRAQEDAGEDL
jgi:hypothetical protein